MTDVQTLGSLVSLRLVLCVGSYHMFLCISLMVPLSARWISREIVANTWH